MDLGLFGFLVGGAPGFSYVLTTMFRVRQAQAEAQKVARQHGEFLDFDSSENQSYDFLLNPRNFIKPSDGPGVRRGKNLLLAIRDKMWKRLWIGVILMIVGMPVGIFAAAAYTQYFLTPH
ncbi:hypothetical protein L2Y94_09710 [Luteibacter aegosomatis]|uniref:hypothetical protein n=1 Tax=Luteibacter aegosomatis TaxID=2911537 RepID=UPI001FF8DF44|nr:hypothetical protein [Luteibacter aegosomatis]UPG87605.1 hypothetical protein L2Y94_09710 [Luteibacter aegosomatis]